MTPPLALYIHYPFCVRICPYCNLHRAVSRHLSCQDLLPSYLTQLTYLARAMNAPPKLTSIFFGGGTPSRMAARTLDTILTHCDQLFGIAPDAELTIEAHPLDHHKFKEFKHIGINRLSLALEALSNDGLNILERPYDEAHAHHSYDKARTIFDNLSCDFIYERPQQTLKMWKDELNKIIALKCDHLSLYELTVSANTLFGKKFGTNPLLDENTRTAFFQETHDTMKKHGYHAYEISNFAHQGKESFHNLCYWRYEPSIAIGPSASGRMPAKDNARRAIKGIGHVNTWIDALSKGKHGFEEWELLTREQLIHEIFLTNLRLHEGLCQMRLHKLTGKNFNDCCHQDKLNSFAQQGLLSLTQDRLRLTERGFLLFDYIVKELLV